MVLLSELQMSAADGCRGRARVLAFRNNRYLIFMAPMRSMRRAWSWLASVLHVASLANAQSLGIDAVACTRPQRQLTEPVDCAVTAAALKLTSAAASTPVLVKGW